MVLLSCGLHGDAESSGLARAAITMNGVSNLRIKDYKYPKIQLFLSSSCEESDALEGVANGNFLRI